MFNENSEVVNSWARLILRGVYKYSQVPALSNLREMVAVVLQNKGYDVNNE